MKEKIIQLLKRANIKSTIFEFNKIYDCLLSELNIKKELSFVDIGSGLCELVNFISNKKHKIDITCLDINDELVELAKSYGFKAITGQITKLTFADRSFDVTHCSHVIEHLGYPEIIIAIDELVRITKPGGIIIIRTPLWANHRFYNDIDHIRPYPPNAIINYFTNKQQQKISKFKVHEIKRWYTKVYYEINPYRFDSKFVKYINILFKLSWLFFSFPSDRYNNYGIVFRKESMV